MPRPAIEVPTKFCQWCSEVIERKRFGDRLEDRSAFLKRRFCCLSCSVSAQHAALPPTDAASRKRAQKLTGECCEICGSTSSLHAHHCDENPMNNEPANLQTLCATCHGYWHGAAKRAKRKPAGRMPPLFP